MISLEGLRSDLIKTSSRQSCCQWKSFANYTLATVLTIGISQVIAVVGLIFLSIKAIYDQYQHAKYAKLARGALENRIKQAEYQAKVAIYQQRIENNRFCAKALGLSLVSLSLNHAKRYLGLSFAIAVADIGLAILGRDRLRTLAFYTANSPSPRPRQKECFEELQKSQGAEAVVIKISLETENHSKGDRELRMIWISGSAGSKYSPSPSRTAILFHGNLAVAEFLDDEANLFRHWGFNVLIVNRNGYPGSSPEHRTTELRSYQDAEAAYDYVKKQLGPEYPDTHMMAFGLSMGSTEATYLASRHSGIHLVLDVPLTSIADCTRNALCNYVPPVFSEQSATALGRYLSLNLFPSGLTDGTHITNGLDNRARISSITGSIFISAGTKDKLMVNPKNRDAFGIGISAGQELADAATVKGNSNVTIDSHDGDHNTTLISMRRAELVLRKHIEDQRLAISQDSHST